MSDELTTKINDNATQGGKEPVPATPECLGKSFEYIKGLLADKHETIVSLDDPILMLVSILNVYIGEFETLHQRHNKALAGLIAAKSSEYISGVKQTTEDLTKTLSDASVEGIKKVFDDQAGRLKSFENNLYWCSALIVISAAVNAALYILK